MFRALAGIRAIVADYTFGTVIVLLQLTMRSPRRSGDHAGWQD